MTRIHQGLEALQRRLAAAPGVVGGLSPEALLAWLLARIHERGADPCFVARCRIRDLRRAHRGVLAHHDAVVAAAEAAYQDCGCGPGIEALQHRLHGIQRGIAGLTEAVEQGRADPDKLAAFERNQDALREQLAQAEAGCAPHGALEAARAEAGACRLRIGLTALQRGLQRSQRERGRRAGRRGGCFEARVEAQVTARVLPHLQLGGLEPICLRGVTLGCARGEFDLLVGGVDPHGWVEVLAMVESKRNINDLSHGFVQRQENLAWLTDDPRGFSPERYRTARYRSGRFDRVAEHHQEGRTYQISPDSFRRFHRDPGCGDFLSGLWLATEDRPLLGVSSGELQQILARVATDPAVELHRPETLEPLCGWILELIHPLQAQDVLQRYARSELAHQILVLEPEDEAR